MRTVLVTGSSRGIGLAIARAFATRGDRVVLNCREDNAALDTACKDVFSIGGEVVGEVMGIRADVSDYADCEGLVRRVERDFGRIDVLVNNAGMAYFGLFSEMTVPQMNEIIAVNLLGVMNMSHIVVPSMVSAKSGCIINISSIWGLCGASCEVAYSAAKAGVNGFTKALAKELAPSGIRVNAIACGAFDTRMNDRLSAHEKNAFEQGIPLGRFGEPAEVGGLAVFLASEGAGYLTGQVVGLDGGGA
ncbi:MAG: 3-oxoacyl-ACP reductase FabG [Defluviitaleaceae bacterium]|nr:3-oxoacyl-ACP reductase FabG [Defluviitaleaceae bacterium]